ncbi:hypothetical protein GCM10010174_40850 [Kutzneria viridogrisea]
MLGLAVLAWAVPPSSPVARAAPARTAATTDLRMAKVLSATVQGESSTPGDGQEPLSPGVYSVVRPVGRVNAN